jgi:hypothetical protein
MPEYQTSHTVKLIDRFERTFTLEITGAIDAASAAAAAIKSIGESAQPRVLSVEPPDPPPLTPAPPVDEPPAEQDEPVVTA